MESMSQAHGEVKQTWANTTYDVMDAQNDALERAGIIDPAVRDRVDEQIREDLEPDQATVDQAEQPRWGESR
jgi:hypothetical protein